MARPFVSVIIPVYNRPAAVREAVASVLQQTWQPGEVIVVDDGSTDDTPAAVQAYGAAVRFFSFAHAGPSAARNRGIERARGEFLAFLDSDDIWLPGKLAAQIDYLQAHPGVRVCQTEEIWIRNNVRVNPMKKHRKHSGWIFEHCLPLCIVSPSAVVIHREVFERVGMFDETMPACEDYDLWLRIAAHYPVICLDAPLVVKRGGHPDQQSRTVARLDRFRIQALCKCLESGAITTDQHEAVLAELCRKCRIYGHGCLKHGRTEEGARYLELPRQYGCGGEAP